MIIDNVLKPTNKPPTVPGWYWAIDKQSHKKEYEIVHVKCNNDIICKLVVGWDDFYSSLDSYDHWIGPLPVPPISENQED